METHSKNTGFGGLSRRRCLAIWNSAAWRASKGGKSENSIAWQAVTAGKSENSLAWEAPTGGKSENSLAWGAPTGGKSENSLAWGARTGGKSENSLAWGAPTGGKSENSLAWGAPTGGKSENSLAWGAPTGGEVKILSLGSPHGGKPPLAPLTDRNKPAVWAATPREAGWIHANMGMYVNANGKWIYDYIYIIVITTYIYIYTYTVYILHIYIYAIQYNTILDIFISTYHVSYIHAENTPLRCCWAASPLGLSWPVPATPWSPAFASLAPASCLASENHGIKTWGDGHLTMNGFLRMEV